MSNFFAALLPCLVSGYILINMDVVRASPRFTAKTGNNLYLFLLAVGFFWTLGTAFLLQLLWKEYFDDIVKAYDMPVRPEMILSSAIALAIRLLTDWFFPADPSEVLKCQTRYLELLVSETIMTKELIMVTMTSGEVYIGSAVRIENFSDKTPEWLLILPVVSGHRNEKTYALELTTDYLEAYEEADKQDKFKAAPSIALPIKEIMSIQKFDSSLHKILSPLDETEEAMGKLAAKGK